MDGINRISLFADDAMLKHFMRGSMPGKECMHRMLVLLEPMETLNARVNWFTVT